MAFGFGRRDGVVRYEVRFDIVGVDGVSREGASVWETRVSRNPFGRTYHTTLRGEAITVSDGADGVYAAVLRAADPSGQIEADQTAMIPESLFRADARAFLSGSEVANRVATVQMIARHPGWSRTLPYEQGLAEGHPMPFVVHLPNPLVPADVVSATPSAKTPGGGPKIIVTIRITDRAVTTGIRKLLPWVHRKNADNKMLDGKRYDTSMQSGLANRMGTGDFSSEAD